MAQKPLTKLSKEMCVLVEENIDLVKHVVFQVAVRFPRHVDREELARAGSLGLVEAARRYDETRGVPFNRFAAQRIRGAILDSVRAADWAPRSIRQLGRELDAVEVRLNADLGRLPSSAETADELGVSLDKLNKLKTRMHRSVVLSLEYDAIGSNDEDMMLGDLLADSDERSEPSMELEHRELVAYLRDAVDLLPERHRLVIVGYFLENRTSQELSRFLGVTESRISQIRSEALDMVKDGIESQYVTEPAEPTSTKERRRARYIDGIASHSAVTDRIEENTVLDLVHA